MDLSVIGVVAIVLVLGLLWLKKGKGGCCGGIQHKEEGASGPAAAGEKKGGCCQH